MKCDILIIGSGASGSVAAITAIKLGLKTIIIEKGKNIGHNIDTKLDLTESIGIEHIIKELSLPINEKSNKSKWFSPNYNLNYNSDIYDLYIKRGADRDSFENKNISRAINKGAELLTDTKINKFITTKNNLVKKVVLQNNNEKIEIKPKFIIGADGTNSRAIQLSNLSKYEHIYGEFHAIGVYGKDFNLPIGITHVFFDKNIAPGGYVFTSKTKNNKCVFGIGFDPSVTHKKPEEILKKTKSHSIISKIFNGAKIKNQFSGFGRYGILTKHSTGNVILVGDAGKFGDPFLCYGMRQAILSGYNAIKTCFSYYESNANFDISHKYELCMKEIQNEIKLGLFLRKSYKKLNNKDIDMIVKIVSNAQKDGLDLDTIFKKDNKFLIKQIIKNTGRCSSITIRILPYIFEYLVKIRRI